MLILAVLRQKSVKDKIFKVVFICLWILAFFYISWGCHYQLKPLEQRLEIEIPKLSIDEFKFIFEEQTQKLVELRSQFDSLNIDFSILENEIRLTQEKLLASWNLPISGRVRIRKIPSGGLLHFRTTGMYIPHAYEGHVDGGLYPIQWPFTLAHEMAHGYGMAYESDCNFIGYLTCIESENPIVRYSGELAYWRYLASQLFAIDNTYYLEKREQLNSDIDHDLIQIRKHIDRFKDLIPKYRTVIYDNYLKTHGIKEGVKNYDRMILLVEGWKRRE